MFSYMDMLFNFSEYDYPFATKNLDIMSLSTSTLPNQINVGAAPLARPSSSLSWSTGLISGLEAIKEKRQRMSNYEPGL
jgi:hypothetical protein